MRISKWISALLIVTLFLISFPVSAFAQTTEQDRVYVLGAVNNPGDFEYKPGITVKQAIDLAGGLAKNADPSGIVLVRASGEKTKVAANDTTAINAGDTVVIKPNTTTDTNSDAVITVQVSGQVRSPGNYPFTPGMTATDAVLLAGGMAETAGASVATINRGGKVVRANLAITTKNAVALEPGDVLTIPQFTASITGEVARPGTYPLVPGQTDNLQGLINAAGGTTPKADFKNIRVSSLQGEESPVKIVDGGNMSARTLTKLQPGDTVFITEVHAQPKHRTSIGEVYQFTIILATLMSIFRH